MQIEFTSEFDDTKSRLQRFYILPLTKWPQRYVSSFFGTSLRNGGIIIDPPTSMSPAKYTCVICACGFGNRTVPSLTKIFRGTLKRK